MFDSNVLAEIEQRAAELQQRVITERDQILSELASAGVDLTKIDSIGLTAGVGGGSILVNGTFCITVVADKNNPFNSQVYVTGEVGLGPNASILGPTALEGGVIGFQGEFTEYSGFVIGVQGGAGIQGSTTMAVPSLDLTFTVGLSSSTSAQLIGSYTVSLDTLRNFVPDNPFSQCFWGGVSISLLDGTGVVA